MDKAESRLVGVHWAALGVLAIPVALGFSSLVEQSAEWQKQHLASQSKQQNQADAEARVQEQSDLALERISGNCSILFDNATGEPTFSLKTNIVLENAKGQPIAVGTDICSRDGSTATVINHLGRLVPADIASVTREDFSQYESFYLAYPEVKIREIQNSDKAKTIKPGEQ